MALNSKIIIQQRMKRKLSQCQLAKECGISQTTLSNIESDRHPNPGLAAAQKLAEYFEMPLDDLIVKGIF